jgi:TRAP-type uncharacterized transport system fused permease subunit
MNTDTSAGGPSAAEIAAESDTGGRALTGTLGGFVALVAFIWACFQLYIASGVPFWVTENFGFNAVFNNTQSRIVHLAFAIALATFSYPLLKRSARHTIPWYDWILAIVGVSCCLYLLVFKDDIASRAGLPTTGRHHCLVTRPCLAGHCRFPLAGPAHAVCGGRVRALRFLRRCRLAA